MWHFPITEPNSARCPYPIPKKQPNALLRQRRSHNDRYPSAHLQPWIYPTNIGSPRHPQWLKRYSSRVPARPNYRTSSCKTNKGPNRVADTRTTKCRIKVVKELQKVHCIQGSFSLPQVHGRWSSFTFRAPRVNTLSPTNPMNPNTPLWDVQFCRGIAWCSPDHSVEIMFNDIFSCLHKHCLSNHVPFYQFINNYIATIISIDDNTNTFYTQIINSYSQVWWELQQQNLTDTELSNPLRGTTYVFDYMLIVSL